MGLGEAQSSIVDTVVGYPDGQATAAIVENYLALVDDSAVAVLPHALRIAAELGIADVIALEALPVADLAVRVGADADALRRLLRALSAAGVVVEVAPGRFGLTAIGQRLRRDAPDSDWASVRNRDSHLAWLDATDSIRTGRSVFEQRHAGGFFAHKNLDADADRDFLRRMRERSGRLYGHALDTLNWRHDRVVMDVGGGDGFLLGRLLDRQRHLAGVLFERHQAIEVARRSAALTGAGHRCQFAAGDFFEALPYGADTHLLCSVLHDWPDSQALRILRNSHQAIASGGRLVIVEMLLPEADIAHASVWSDLGMLVLTGGRERTEAEFAGLLSTAGFRVSRVYPVAGSCFSVIEAARVDAVAELPTAA